ncbi:MAG TPA: DUF3857 domain-containing protein [Flavobacterium sp.]|uniref:DUF3857 domain-containing protein n=1 Tax=Flavobacterium sp. TaxID=239 RepID=UPI002CAEC84F|nr:DUF3857 domain-containing protein [Flavobacterium sp.]HNP32127.1 DUF3857 domain-containing protein [Flavobacterium sp.]
MRKIIIAICVLMTSLSISQNHELGKVTIEELKEKACPSDTSAAAAVLFNVGRTYFEYSGDDGFRIITEINTKIKIYKKEGYEYANHTERAYIGGNSSEKIDVSKAVTYNLVGDKIEKTKLGSDGEFDEKVNKFWNRKKITMPNVKVGSIIEYRIVITSPYISNFPDWEFQKDIPVNYSEYTTFIPEYFVYNVHSKGYFTPKNEKSSKGRTINYSYSEGTVPILSRTTNSGVINTSMNFQENVVKYTLENIPALKDEGYVNNIKNYQAKLIHELSMTKYPHSPIKSYATDWESVVKGIYNNDDFGTELNKTGYFEKDIDAVLNGVTAPEERIATIFNYVKNRMNFTEFQSIYCDDGVKKAYQDKKGNAAEINLMLTAMLRYAGVQANPVIISTRSNEISLFPSKSAYNYVISGVELNNQIVLFDATSKYSLPNILPIRDLNWFGRIIRKDGTSEGIDLMPTSNSKDVVSIMASINEKGEVTGKIRDQYFDYNAFMFRVNNNAIAKESYVEKLEKRHEGLEIGEYNVQNNTDLSQPIIENYDFTSNNSVEIIGDKMYVSPFLFFAMKENPFKQETREYPIDFIYPDQSKFNISLTIPAGYVVETLPQPKAVSMPENLGSFKYIISNNGSQIQLLYTHDTNQAIIGTEYYEALKNFYKEIVDKQTEKIVLKKV